MVEDRALQIKLSKDLPVQFADLEGACFGKSNINRYLPSTPWSNLIVSCNSKSHGTLHHSPVSFVYSPGRGRYLILALHMMANGDS